MTFLGFGMMAIGVIMIILAFTKLFIPILSLLLQIVLSGFFWLTGEINNFLFGQSSENEKKELNPTSQSPEDIKLAKLLYVVNRKYEYLKAKYPLADESLFDEFAEAYKNRPLPVSKEIEKKIASQHEKREQQAKRRRK